MRQLQSRSSLPPTQDGEQNVIDFSPTVLVILLAVSVALVGMPHGGLDHRCGRALLKPRFRQWWWLVFLAAYLGTAFLIVAGWFLLPSLTVVLFFVISAWHFGDDLSAEQPSKIVEGGMVIWLPLLFRPNEVASLLAWVIPNGDQARVTAGVEMVQPLLWATAVFFAVRLPFEATPDAAGRKVAFALLFAVLPTLASFMLYFCGWHSTRELALLARRADPTRPWHGLLRVLTVAGPMAALAVAMTMMFALVFAGDRETEPVVVQAVFMGLSAVAVPHILLQEMVRRCGVNVFEPETMA